MRTVVLPIWIRLMSTSKHASSFSRASYRAAIRTMVRLLNLKMSIPKPTKRLVLEALRLLSGERQHRLEAPLPSPLLLQGRLLIGTVASTNFSLRLRLKLRLLMDLTPVTQFERPQLFSNQAPARNQEGASPKLSVLSQPPLALRRLHYLDRVCTHLRMHFLSLLIHLHHLTSVPLAVLVLLPPLLEARCLLRLPAPHPLPVPLTVPQLLAALCLHTIVHSHLQLKSDPFVMNGRHPPDPLTRTNSITMAPAYRRAPTAPELRAVHPHLHLP
jgi:hypothetical protein